MKKHTLVLVSIALLSTGLLQAQTRLEKKATALYDQLSYVQAVPIYEKVVAKGYTSADLYNKLANSYYFMGKVAEAATYYEKQLEVDPAAEANTYFRYAQTQASLGNSQKYTQYMAAFAKALPTDTRAVRYKDKAYYNRLREAFDGSYAIAADSLPINTPNESTYGAFEIGDALWYLSTAGDADQQKQEWTGQRFTNLYKAPLSDLANQSAVAFAEDAQANGYLNGPAVVSKDGSTMYITRANTNGKFLKRNKAGRVTLKIYRLTKTETGWSTPIAMPFSSDAYNTSHPALSADGAYLYFVSDKEGGKGSSDIYKCRILEGYNVTEMVNLGTIVNTEARETFISIDENNILYFASDGHVGLGGLDVFAYALNDPYAVPQNLGTPINSPSDDFGFSNTVKGYGYVSSNRAAGQDKVYKAQQLTSVPVACTNSLTGEIAQSYDNQPAAGITVQLIAADNTVFASTTTNENGVYEFTQVPCGEKYLVQASGEAFITQELGVASTTDYDQTTLKTLKLPFVQVPLEQGTNLTQFFNLRPVLFGFNKSYVTKDAMEDVAKVAAVLEEYPKATIRVISHTDQLGDAGYNQRLSARRAKNTKQVLVDMGIAEERIEAIGAGATQPKLDCTGKKCTVEEHRVNRRSEFVITSAR